MQWIKTTDRLPDVGAPVLFYTIYDMCDVGELAKGGYRGVPWVFCGFEAIYKPEEVTYWALITEPPKEG